MTRRRHRFRLKQSILLALFLVLVGTGYSQTSTIAEARALDLGSTATIRAIVTSPSYASTYTNYYIQDATAGINLYASNGNINPPLSLSLGDSIEVTGEIATYASFMEIIIKSTT